jgi:hypothetical protein
MDAYADVPADATTGDNALFLKHILIIIGRAFTYLLVMTRFGFFHTRALVGGIMRGDGTITVLTRHFRIFYNILSFSLMVFLVIMLLNEPVLWCHNFERLDVRLNQEPCDYSRRYKIFSMVCMVFDWLLIIDFAVFSTALSAFVLVCAHVISRSHCSAWQL